MSKTSTNCWIRIVLVGCVILSLVSSLWWLGLEDFDVRSSRHNLDDLTTFSITTSKSSTAITATRHVLYALSGDHPSFFREFEVSLKSVLLNAPCKNPLTIHIMADRMAYKGLQEIVFANLTITDIRLPTSIAIRLYNVQGFEQKWDSTIRKRTAVATTMVKRLRLYGHTMGTWYRLFAADVLPPTVETVVYLDSDVVIMANLENVWTQQQEIERQRGPVLFYWGESQCAGFLVLKPQLEIQQQLWDTYTNAPRSVIKTVMDVSKVVSDQHVLQVVQAVSPQLVGILGLEWDVSVVNRLWLKLTRSMAAHRPNGVGMLHFNGGGTSPHAFFESGEATHYFKDKYWNLAKYYVDLPWNWAFFQMYSRIGIGEPSYSLQFHYINDPILQVAT